MSSITDLRRTLDQHADDVADPAGVARTLAVHHRIAVRRRQRAAGAGALAVAMVAAVAAVAWPRAAERPAPAAPVVLGQRAPATMTSLGYTYRADGHGESFGRSGSIRVLSSAKPQLFSWTTDVSQDVTVTLPDGNVMHSTRSRFRDFVVLPPGSRGRLTVQVSRGRVGLAGYDLTAAAPAGYTKSGMTFRQKVAGTSLLTARISDPGEQELRASYLAPKGQIREYLICGGLKKGQVVTLSFNGEGRDWAEPQVCNARGATFDPASGGNGEYRVAKPGRPVVVRAFVTDKVGGTRMLPADQVKGVWFGFAVYGPTSETAAGGWQVPDEIEEYGHTWLLTTTRTSSGPALVLPAADHDRLATTVSHSLTRSTRVYFRAGDSRSGIENGVGVGGSSASPGLWAPAGARVHVTMDRGRGTFGVGLYERED